MSLVDATTRWWVQPPRPDESLRSLLNRAAAVYECSPGMLWDSLNADDSRPWGDVDAPSCAALLRISNAVGVPVARLHLHRLPDAPWLMVSEERRSYCPKCWNLDLDQDYPCAIQRGWSRVLQTTCPIHRFPLYYAQETWASGTGRFKFEVPCFSPAEQGILELVQDFGTALERSLYFGEPWPKGWRSTPHAARLLLISLSFNANPRRDFPAISNIHPGGNLSSIIHGPRCLQEPVSRLTWDAFRSIGNPAIRRAALWATASMIVPDLPLAHLPGWFPLPPVPTRG